MTKRTAISLLILFVMVGAGCESGPAISNIRGVYLVLPGDGFESNEIQRQLTQIDIPGPPDSDFRLPDGVVGVASVFDRQASFAARVQFSSGARSGEIAAFVSEAERVLGAGAVFLLEAGAEWPDCAGGQDCQQVDG